MTNFSLSHFWGMRNHHPSRKAELMKRLTYQPAIAALALILASCSSSPIKQLVCNNEEGKVVQEIIFDPKDKVVYEYDEFSESLKPLIKPSIDGFYDEWEIAFTDSGKIKHKRVVKGEYPLYGLVSLKTLIEINLQKLAFKGEEIETNSKLKDITAAEGAAAIDEVTAHNLKIINSSSTIEKNTTTTKGTCKYVTPKITKVFEG